MFRKNRLFSPIYEPKYPRLHLAPQALIAVYNGTVWRTGFGLHNVRIRATVPVENSSSPVLAVSAAACHILVCDAWRCPTRSYHAVASVARTGGHASKARGFILFCCSQGGTRARAILSTYVRAMRPLARIVDSSRAHECRLLRVYRSVLRA